LRRWSQRSPVRRWNSARVTRTVGSSASISADVQRGASANPASKGP
jgi:hypothetical protein